MGPMKRPSLRPIVPIAVAFGLLGASCGELEPPGAYSVSTSTSVADGVEQETDSQIQEQPGLVTAGDGGVPTAGPDYEPLLLVSGSSLILGADSVGSAPLPAPYAGLQTIRAVDDLGEGLVVQEIGGDIVYHQWQAESAVIDDTGGRLLDVGFWDGSPQAFVEVVDPSGAVAVDRIQLVTEIAGAQRNRQRHFDLADGEQIVSFSASRDIQAVIVQDNECGGLRFYGMEGDLIDLQGFESPPCVFFDRPSFGAVALSPDGEAVAYTLIEWAGDGTEEATELVTQQLVVDSEFPRRTIGESLDAITSLAFDGDRVGYVKVSKSAGAALAEETTSVTLLTLIGERSEVLVDVLEAGEVSSVSFARIRLGTEA